MKKISLILVLTCIGLFWSFGWAYSAVDILLKIEGIEGESIVEDHEGEIDILAWSWQMSATTTMPSGGGAGKAIVRPLLVKKWVDKASPHIFISLLNGTLIPEAILTVKKAGENPIDYIRIVMRNVQFVNLSPDSTSEDDRAAESVAISFSRVCYAYTPQKADGSPDAVIEKCWDIEQNIEP